MVRSPARALTADLQTLRQHLQSIVQSALSAAAADQLLHRALADPTLNADLAGRSINLVAAGKASRSLVPALYARFGGQVRQAVAAGISELDTPTAPGLAWLVCGHPEPNAASVAAGEAALLMARATGPKDRLVVLLSGGASALLAVPLAGVSLEDKQAATRCLLAAGADITALNIVRKHLSAIKGGRLAAAAHGRVLTFVLSDVVGDDLSVIGSGPTCPDPTTFADALDVIDRLGVRERVPSAVLDCLLRGTRGDVRDTPKVAAVDRDDRMVVIGSRLDALEGARRAAESLGYAVGVLDDPITGEARVAGAAYVVQVAACLAHLGRPACVLSAGETTVTVSGRGLGGRNQEFALAVAPAISSLGARVALASVGTDGVDGPTDAAGAIADASTIDRARASGLAPREDYLSRNDSYRFFEALHDLIVIGPTHTNVGDIQVVLVAE